MHYFPTVTVPFVSRSKRFWCRLSSPPSGASFVAVQLQNRYSNGKTKNFRSAAYEKLWGCWSPQKLEAVLPNVVVARTLLLQLEWKLCKSLEEALGPVPSGGSRKVKTVPALRPLSDEPELGATLLSRSFWYTTFCGNLWLCEPVCVPCQTVSWSCENILCFHKSVIE